MNFFSLLKRKIIYKFKKKYSIDNDSFSKKNLDYLFHYYGSDKSNIFKINNSPGHGFSLLYENHLRNLIGRNINILEIGSFAGASAAAFVKYFQNANIFCFDVNISNFKYTSKNIHVYGIDIKNKKKVNKTLIEIFNKNDFKKFDLIIDDGSHQLSDILHSLNFFFKYLKKEGTFIIEDYKHPNYYKYNYDIDDILVDDLLLSLKRKNLFKSLIFNKEDQAYLINSIKEINTYKGNLKDSDICFIKKN